MPAAGEKGGFMNLVRIVCLLIVLPATTLGTPAITDKNWTNHPEIQKIRALYNEINAAGKANKLKKEAKK